MWSESRFQQKRKFEKKDAVEGFTPRHSRSRAVSLSSKLAPPLATGSLPGHVAQVRVLCAHSMHRTGRHT